MIICLSEKEARKLGILEAIKKMKPHIGENPYFHYDKNILIELDYDQAVELGFINPSLPNLNEEEECQVIKIKNNKGE